MAPQARVFISCGQSFETTEIETARAIEHRLRDMGFDPYVATEEQTLRGLKENLFQQLENSEYFLFVDFRRERLGDGEPPVFRGSLFSHQELALASYLDLPVLAFQEIGVRREDGIMRFLQANATPFIDRNLLANAVADLVSQRGWLATWRNEIVLSVREPPFGEATVPGAEQYSPARFFHIDAANNHRSRLATNCYAYLERVTKVGGGNIPVQTIEFRWAGASIPNVGIAPNSRRAFDAFLVFRGDPSNVRFNLWTTSSDYIPRLSGIGDYDMTYTVISENFPPARASFRLHVDSAWENTNIMPIT